MFIIFKQKKAFKMRICIKNSFIIQIAYTGVILRIETYNWFTNITSIASNRYLSEVKIRFIIYCIKCKFLN